MSTPSHKPRPMPNPPAHAPAEECILVLQGGGALGAYQAGVFESLSELFREPSWWPAYPSAPSTPR